VFILQRYVKTPALKGCSHHTAATCCVQSAQSGQRVMLDRCLYWSICWHHIQLQVTK